MYLTKNKNSKIKCILNELITVIEQIKEKDDFYLFEENEAEVKSWLVELDLIKNAYELEIFSEKVKDRVYYCYYDDLSECELESTRKDLLMELLDELFSD